MGVKDIEIFQKQEDYRNWDKLSQHCDILEGLTEFEKERAKRAFQYLREELGENFLDNAFNAQHPICLYVINLVPWTRKWITWLAEAMRELKEHDNYVSILNRIKNGDKAKEGLSVLEIAYKFSKMGFKVSFDPSIKISQVKKIPDLKIANEESNEAFFVEVSILEESRVQKQAFNTLQKITEPLWRSIPFIHYCGRIHKSLAERHVDDLVNKIEKMVERVKRENILQELVIEDVIEIGMAPENDKRFLEKWAEEKGLNVGEFSGPPYDANEISRTKRKIEKEQRQLPHDHPNILVVKNNHLFSNARNIRKVISELEEEIYNYSHLLFVVVAGGHMGMDENVITMKDQHVFIKKSKIDFLVEQFIILFNRFCFLRISPGAITKIYEAFRSY